MADVQHVDITDPQIHEPKDASTASTGTVYVADGSGSGAWALVDTDTIDMTALETQLQSDLDDGTLEVTGSYFITVKIDDISTADSVLIPVIKDSTVVGARVVLGGAITTADAAISFKNAAAASMGTDVTVAYTSSAKGDGYNFTATGNNELTGPTYIEVATDGASDTAQPVYITVEFTAQLN